MQQLQKMKTALIGSGMISGIYLKNMKEQFDILKLMGCSDIRPERIVGHSDIAPGRKTDPGGAFDWPRLRAALTEESTQ